MLQLYGEQVGNCNGCRTHFDDPAHFHIDHIYPKSKGGPWMLDNLQLLCGRCNTVKGDRPMEYLNAALKARDAQIQMYGLRWIGGGGCLDEGLILVIGFCIIRIANNFRA